MPERPTVDLVGEDGNAFAILGRCRTAARRAGWTDREWNTFRSAATSGDYAHLLATVLEWFAVAVEWDDDDSHREHEW